MKKPPLKKRYPNLLRRSRKAHGWNQKQVAELLGVKNTAMISSWEKSHKHPNAINMFKLSAIYGVMVEELFSPLVSAVWREKIERQKKVYRKEKRASAK
jgi:transcriptional regulator with XRE-family HTH domain